MGIILEDLTKLNRERLVQCAPAQQYQFFDRAKRQSSSFKRQRPPYQPGYKPGARVIKNRDQNRSDASPENRVLRQVELPRKRSRPPERAVGARKQ